MDLNLIKKLVKIVDTSEITDLEIEEEGFKIRIAKKIRGLQNFAQPQVMAHSVPAEQQTAKKEEQDSAKPVAKDNTHEVRSPIVGTFYRAPAPDADSYVNVGDVVSPGSVLCIVEAMKLMNEIESDASGKIIKILVENGKPVEYKQPLFLLQVS
jgi:acetyl-CoA carboxylase biotin carboxyl carrier protein